MIHRRGTIIMIICVIIFKSICRLISICISISRSASFIVFQSILRAPLAAICPRQWRFWLNQFRIGITASKLLLPCFLWVEIIGNLIHIYYLFLSFSGFAANFFNYLFVSRVNRLKNIDTFIQFGIGSIWRFSCYGIAWFVVLLILLLKYAGRNWRLADISVHGNSRAWPRFHLLFDELGILRGVSFSLILAVRR